MVQVALACRVECQLKADLTSEVSGWLASSSTTGKPKNHFSLHLVQANNISLLGIGSLALLLVTNLNVVRGTVGSAFFIHVLISISFDFITELCFEICILRLTLSYWLGWIWQLLLQGFFPVRVIARPQLGKCSPSLPCFWWRPC